MADGSSIEWTEATWNPVTGCEKVSLGCDHCYAETFAERFRGVPGHAYEQGFDVRLWPDRLRLPLRWRTPRLVFVNSMSDLFHHRVPDEFIAAIFGTMSRTPHHTYQLLTKRHGRMASLLTSSNFLQQVEREVGTASEFRWPIPNVWLGTSVEDQKRADLRIPRLTRTPAVVRFLSCEPLLGPLDLSAWVDQLDWVIVGGESGPRARPMELEWARSIVAQCRAARVAVFVKQLGRMWVQTTPQARSDPKGGDWQRWPRDLRRREMPLAAASR